MRSGSRSALTMAVAVVGVFSVSAHVHAGLTLSIDTTAKQFWLTGAASGTTSSLGRVVWSLGDSTSTQVSSANTAVISTSPSRTVSQIRIGSVGSADATLGIWFSQINASTTITGAGGSEKVYYGGMDPTTIAAFESGAGKTAPLTEGSGFGSLNFQLFVVPEPSSWAMGAGGFACAAWWSFRRRKRA